MCFLSANRWGFPAGKQGLCLAPVYREVTPLSKRLTDIRQRIQRERATLTQEGQRVVVVIATDGMPTTPHSGQSVPSDRSELVCSAYTACAIHQIMRCQ